jgi:hypothetical protein
MFVLAGVALLTGALWAWHAWAAPRTNAVIISCHQITGARDRWYPSGVQTLDACQVSWSAADGRHIATMDLPARHYRPGDRVTLAVHGHHAEVPASPRPLIYLGAVSLIAVAIGRSLLPVPAGDEIAGRQQVDRRPG